MTPESIAILIASVLGSTGLASLIGSGAGFTRTARLRSAVAATKSSLDGLDSESSAYRATQASITVMSLELASYALVRVPMRSRAIIFIGSILFLFAILFIVTAGAIVHIISDPLSNITVAEVWSSDVGIILNNEVVSKEYWWIYTVIYIFYIFIVSAMLVMQAAHRRERFVAGALKQNDVDYALIIKHGAHLHEHDSEKNPATTGPGTDFSKIRHFVPPEKTGQTLKVEKKHAWLKRWTPKGS